MKLSKGRPLALAAASVGVALALGLSVAQESKRSSYAPVDIQEPLEKTMAKMKAQKPEVMKRQMELLQERYDLSNRPAPGVTMSRGKPVQEGVRVKLPAGVTWDQLAGMTPEEIREKNLWPKGFLPLPHPNSCRGRHGLPQIPHRGGEETGRQGPYPLRPGL